LALSRDVVRINQFTTDMDGHLANRRDQMATVFGEHKPTSTIVEVTRLVHPDWKIEIEASGGGQRARC
jgi:2-iminobutanoate/2-iminopropanoate deaminase